MTNMFTKKSTLITGGTGSFGNVVLKRFLHTDIADTDLMPISLLDKMLSCEDGEWAGRDLEFQRSATNVGPSSRPKCPFFSEGVDGVNIP